MRFHHVCLIVSDLDRALELWTKLFDFEIDVQVTAPDDALAASPDASFSQLIEDIKGIPDTRTKVALLSSPGGARLELLQSLNPPTERLPEKYHSYFQTGMRELGFRVDGIDAWFEKVRDAGYRLQTPYVWSFGETGRSFAFHDDDGHIIQLWEDDGRAGW